MCAWSDDSVLSLWVPKAAGSIPAGRISFYTQRCEYFFTVVLRAAIIAIYATCVGQSTLDVIQEGQDVLDATNFNLN
jgi:hypothetical protein